MLWKFSLERVRVSNEKGIEINIHSHSTAFKNDFIGHKIIVMLFFFFLLILVTAISGRPKPELCFLLGPLR